jgi:hypothetical protein
MQGAHLREQWLGGAGGAKPFVKAKVVKEDKTTGVQGGLLGRAHEWWSGRVPVALMALNASHASTQFYTVL